METNQDKRKPFAHEPAPSSADAVLSGSAGLLPAEGQPRRLEPEDEEGTLGRDLQDLQVSSSSARPPAAPRSSKPRLQRFSRVLTRL